LIIAFLCFVYETKVDPMVDISIMYFLWEFLMLHP